MRQGRGAASGFFGRLLPPHPCKKLRCAHHRVTVIILSEERSVVMNPLFGRLRRRRRVVGSVEQFAMPLAHGRSSVSCSQWMPQQTRRRTLGITLAHTHAQPGHRNER